MTVHFINRRWDGLVSGTPDQDHEQGFHANRLWPPCDRS